jgi:putative flippase GtrA
VLSIKFLFLNIAYFFNKLIYKNYKKNISGQFFRHLLVGAIGFIGNYFLFNILKYFRYGTLLSNTVTNVVIIIVVYNLQKYFTYQNKKISLTQPVLYLFNALFYYILDTAILIFLIDKNQVDPKLGKMLSLIVTTPINFLFQKFVVFKE